MKFFSRFKSEKAIAIVILILGAFTALIVYAAHSECFAPGGTPTSHQSCYWGAAKKTATTTVLEFSANYCVQNGNNSDIFIPTKTQQEWFNFRQFAPNQTLTNYSSGSCGNSGLGSCTPTPAAVSGSAVNASPVAGEAFATN